MAAVLSVLSLLSFVPAGREAENNTSSAQGNPSKSDTWFCNLQCNSESLDHSLLIKELAALTLQALALLSVSQPVCFSGCSFPSFQAILVLPREWHGQPLVLPLAAGSKSTSCIRCPASCSRAEFTEATSAGTSSRPVRLCRGTTSQCHCTHCSWVDAPATTTFPPKSLFMHCYRIWLCVHPSMEISIYAMVLVFNLFWWHFAIYLRKEKKKLLDTCNKVFNIVC